MIGSGSYKTLARSRKLMEKEGESFEIVISKQPTIEPVTLEEVKAHARIDSIDDDLLLDGLIIACRKEAERICDRSFITQEITVEWAYMGNFVILPRPPHQSIVKVERSTMLNWRTLKASEYRVSGLQRFRIDVDRFFSTLGWSESPFRVTYIAGEGDDADHIDERIKPALLDMVLVAFDNRGQVKTADGGQLGGLMTPMAQQLLDGLTNFR